MILFGKLIYKDEYLIGPLKRRPNLLTYKSGKYPERNQLRRLLLLLRERRRR